MPPSCLQADPWLLLPMRVCRSVLWFQRVTAPLASTSGGQSRGSASWGLPSALPTAPHPATGRNRGCLLEMEILTYMPQSKPQDGVYWHRLPVPGTATLSLALLFLRTVMGICSQNF